MQNRYKSRRSNDIDMKVGPVSKLDKRNTVRATTIILLLLVKVLLLTKLLIFYKKNADICKIKRVLVL